MKFRLGEAIYTKDGAFLTPGTIVDITDNKDIVPSMVPQDDESQAAFDATYQWNVANQQWVRTHQSGI